jgi:hypothetical protein
MTRWKRVPEFSSELGDASTRLRKDRKDTGQISATTMTATHTHLKAVPILQEY